MRHIFAFPMRILCKETVFRMPLAMLSLEGRKREGSKGLSRRRAVAASGAFPKLITILLPLLTISTTNC